MPMIDVAVHLAVTRDVCVCGEGSVGWWRGGSAGD